MPKPLLLTSSDARRHFDDDSPGRFAVKKRQGLGYLGTEVRVVDELPTTATGKVQKYELREREWEKDRMVGPG